MDNIILRHLHFYGCFCTILIIYQTHQKSRRNIFISPVRIPGARFLKTPRKFRLWKAICTTWTTHSSRLSFKHVFKVSRYSFFGTIPNFLNRLLDSLVLVRSTWNLPYLLVLGWTLAWFTFSENRYFHDNDKQKSSKTVKLKFYAIQISLWKANTNILNCGVWHTKYTRTKKFCMFVLK